MNDVSRIRQIGCLPVKERRYFHLLNLVHKALYSPNWPTYVQLVKVQHKRTLRSSQATRLQIPLEKGTFQDATATHFKALPAKLRQCTALKSHSFFPRVNLQGVIRGSRVLSYSKNLPWPCRKIIERL